MRGAIIAALSLLAGACTYHGQAPQVDISSTANIGARQPGHFAALVQTGGWNMTTKVVGMNCWTSSYDADLNPAWDQTMKSGLAAALEKVDFVPGVLTAQDLASKGYAAQIMVSQSNGSSQTRAISHFFGGEAVSETSLDGILVISYPDGTRQQQAIAGKGTSNQETYTCSGVEPAVVNAGATAVKDIAERTITTVKLLLAQKVHPLADK